MNVLIRVHKWALFLSFLNNLKFVCAGNEHTAEQGFIIGESLYKEMKPKLMFFKAKNYRALKLR
jgi:hypothetical protein